MTSAMILILAVVFILAGSLMERRRLRASSGVEFFVKRLLPKVLYGAAVGLLIVVVLRVVL